MTQKSKTNNKPYGLLNEIRDFNKKTFENFINKFHDNDEMIMDFCSNFIYKTPKTTITLPYYHALKNTDCITFLNNFHFLKNGFLDKNNMKKMKKYASNENFIDIFNDYLIDNSRNRRKNSSATTSYAQQPHNRQYYYENINQEQLVEFIKFLFGTKEECGEIHYYSHRSYMHNEEYIYTSFAYDKFMNDLLFVSILFDKKDEFLETTYLSKLNEIRNVDEIFNNYRINITNEELKIIIDNEHINENYAVMNKFINFLRTINPNISEQINKINKL